MKSTSEIFTSIKELTRSFPPKSKYSKRRRCKSTEFPTESSKKFKIPSEDKLKSLFRELWKDPWKLSRKKKLLLKRKKSELLKFLLRKSNTKTW